MADDENPIQDESHEEGGFDLVALLYIVGGIPAMVAFFVGLFALVHLFDFPA